MLVGQGPSAVRSRTHTAARVDDVEGAHVGGVEARAERPEREQQNGHKHGQLVGEVGLAVVEKHHQARDARRHHANRNGKPAVT